MNQELFLAISGMSCVNCARGIESGLTGKPGIALVRVYLGDESAEIQFDPRITSTDEIVGLIRELGYEGRVLGKVQEESGDWLPVFFSALLAAPIVYWSMFASPTPANLLSQMILSGLLLMTTGRRFFTGAARALKQGNPNMDVLVALGVGTSWAYSTGVLAVTRLGVTEMVHYEAVAMLVLFILLGKTLEGRARHKASESLRGLTALQHGPVRRLVPGETGGDVLELADISDVTAGDRLKILPGERFPIDGRILSGESAADESLLTGEAMPVPKNANAPVISGTMNLSGELLVKVERAGADSTLASLIRTVRRAQADRPQIQRFADQASAYFVPAILVLGALTFLGWLLTGHPLQHAIMHAVAVLVVACPCALGLATPMAIIVASGIAMQRGLLVKKPSALEALADVSFFLLDKTGTLTKGSPEVQEMIVLDPPNRDLICQMAFTLAGKSIHPLSRALVSYLRDSECHHLKLKSFEERRGYGLSADDQDGRTWTLGNLSLMEEKGVTFPALSEDFTKRALTPVFLSRDETPVAVFGLADQPRDEAREAISRLKDRGIAVAMVSGDRRGPAESVAQAVGITDVHAEVLPEGKLSILQTYLQRGKTAFVGDGINDSPALSAATVGLAMGSGADVAQEATDLVLIGKDLRLLAFAVDLSRATLRKIRQNLGWAVIYNLLALPLASGILIPVFGPAFQMNPAVAGLAMACSSLSVVLNSLLLIRQCSKGDTIMV